MGISGKSATALCQCKWRASSGRPLRFARFPCQSWRGLSAENLAAIPHSTSARCRPFLALATGVGGPVSIPAAELPSPALALGQLVQSISAAGGRRISRGRPDVRLLSLTVLTRSVLYPDGLPGRRLTSSNTQSYWPIAVKLIISIAYYHAPEPIVTRANLCRRLIKHALFIHELRASSRRVTYVLFPRDGAGVYYY